MNHKDNPMDKDPLDALESGEAHLDSESKPGIMPGESNPEPKRGTRLWLVLAGLLGVGGYLFYQQKQVGDMPNLNVLPEAANTNPSLPKIASLGTPNLSQTSPSSTNEPSTEQTTQTTSTLLSDKLAGLAKLQNQILDEANKATNADVDTPKTNTAPESAVAPSTTPNTSTMVIPAIEAPAVLTSSPPSTTDTEIYQARIQALEAQVAQLNQSLSTLNANIMALENRLLALNSQQGRLLNEVASLRANSVAVQEPFLATQNPVPPLPPSQAAYLKSMNATSQTASITQSLPYSVHAIIPGRAWLKTTDGQQIITVTEGDKLGDYGKVLVIDAASGMVLTSSGTHFQ